MQKTLAAPRNRKEKLIRGILLVAGTISLALGAIGLVLPILPTTPFLLLAAACYLRSSERMHKWLINNRWFGEYIRNYQAGRGVSMRVKLFAVGFLWATILFTILLVVDEILIAQIVLLAIAVGVSIHLFRLPTFKKQNQL
ncbi:MAG: YbaN family protein [Candidatus Bathyarchaeota archaeon]|nr:YbaN family protein [Candidatus Bathyarchaeota archaeon]